MQQCDVYITSAIKLLSHWCTLLQFEGTVIVCIYSSHAAGIIRDLFMTQLRSRPVCLLAKILRRDTRNRNRSQSYGRRREWLAEGTEDTTGVRSAGTVFLMNIGSNTMVIKLFLFLLLVVELGLPDLYHVHIPVAALSKAWVWGGSLAVIAGSNSAGGMNISLL
jgi:hypothetical protein